MDPRDRSITPDSESGDSSGGSSLDIVAPFLIVLVAVAVEVLPLLEGSSEPSLAFAGPWRWLRSLPVVAAGLDPSVAIGLGIGLLAGISGLYIASLVLAQRTPRSARPLLVILLVTALTSILVVTSPPTRDADLLYYAFQGRMIARQHVNPYLVPPRAREADPWFPLVSPTWRDLTTGYGPVWLLTSAGVDVLADQGGSLSDVVRTVLAFRALFAVLTLANTLLIWLILGELAPPRQLIGSLAYAWNPAVLLVGMEHNDTVMLFLALLGVWLHRRRRPWLAVVAFTLSALIKYFTLPLLVGYVIWRWRSETRGTLSRALLILTPVLITALSLAPFNPLAVVGNFPTYLGASGRAAHVERLPFELVALVAVVTTARFVRLTQHERFGAVIEAGTLALLVYLAVFSRDWFPWYLITAIGLSALLGGWWLGIAAAGAAAWLLDLHQGTAYLAGIGQHLFQLSPPQTVAIVVFGPAVLVGALAAFAPRQHTPVMARTGVAVLLGLTMILEAPLAGLGPPVPLLDAAALTPGGGPIIFGQSLEWDDWSWGVVVQQVGTPAGPAGGRSLCVTYATPQGALYVHQSGLALRDYRVLTFDLGPPGPVPTGLVLTLRATNGTPLGSTPLEPYLNEAQVVDGWRAVQIPLAALGAENATVSGVLLQSEATESGKTVCLQDLLFR